MSGDEVKGTRGTPGLPRPAALYVHVPFCPTVCPYCDFAKMRRHEGLVAAYLARLAAEAEDLHRRHPQPLDTIYIGGGTPSHLTDAELEGVVKLIDGLWGWPGRLETTLEADPLTFDTSRARHFDAMGFDRLSVGVQSAQDPVLAFLGRRHTAAEGLVALDAALAAALRVSADVITAVPGQDAAADLRAVAASGVGHMSVYSLTVERHTPFAFRGVVVDPDQDADDYDATQRILPAHGLERYEVSNHARPGEESRHNATYWRGDYYLALGPGATSFLPAGGATANDDAGAAPAIGVRRRAPRMKAWLAGGPAEEATLVRPEDYVQDVMMTGLRTTRGVDLAEVHQRTGIDAAVRHAAAVAAGVEAGELVLDPPRLRATDAGLRRLNAVVGRFLDMG